MTQCFKLWLWIAYKRDEVVTYGLDRGSIYTYREEANKRMTEVSIGLLRVFYDPLLDNVFTIDDNWDNQTVLGLLATCLCMIGWLVLTCLLLYNQVIPWVRECLEKRIEHDIELM